MKIKEHLKVRAERTFVETVAYGDFEGLPGMFDYARGCW